MGSHKDWQDVVARIQEAPNRYRSPHVKQLYALAMSDGGIILRSFQKKLGTDRIHDLIHDVLASALDAILDAESPRAFFSVALKRKAIDWNKRGGASVVGRDPWQEDAGPADGGGGFGKTEAIDHAFVIDARNALAMLPERDRDIVHAVGQGEDREVVAREHRTSRANVDQIFSRTKKNFRAASGGASE